MRLLLPRIEEESPGSRISTAEARTVSRCPLAKEVAILSTECGVQDPASSQQWADGSTRPVKPRPVSSLDNAEPLVVSPRLVSSLVRLVRSCRVLSCHVLSCPVMSRHVSSRLVLLISVSSTTIVLSPALLCIGCEDACAVSAWEAT